MGARSKARSPSASEGKAAARWGMKWPGVIFAGFLAFLLAFAFRQFAPSSEQAQLDTMQTRAPTKHLPANDALSHFSEAHNASLLWGTYRPGVYFGLRSRTTTTALVAGLMWTRATSD